MPVFCFYRDLLRILARSGMGDIFCHSVSIQPKEVIYMTDKSHQWVCETCGDVLNSPRDRCQCPAVRLVSGAATPPRRPFDSGIGSNPGKPGVKAASTDK